MSILHNALSTLAVKSLERTISMKIFHVQLREMESLKFYNTLHLVLVSYQYWDFQACSIPRHSFNWAIKASTSARIQLYSTVRKNHIKYHRWKVFLYIFRAWTLAFFVLGLARFFLLGRHQQMLSAPYMSFYTICSDFDITQGVTDVFRRFGRTRLDTGGA